tara:strand:+ start:463 stop:1509 length:1047 start_codon:yes stop_codon:yes gene_type:complete
MFFNDFIFISILVSYSYIQNRFLLHFFNKNKLTVLSDSNFIKPQAFHEKPTYRLGGIAIFIPLLLTYLYFYIYKDIYEFEFISFCSLFFILGLLDDSKIEIRPKFRLMIMILFLLFLIIKNETYIEKTGFEFLDTLLEIDIFALIFISLCFLFIINGSNLIDGFNGLLSIHSLIIFIVLFFINLTNESNNLIYILLYTSVIILVFIYFNFPNAKMFLGDSGAYLIGSFIAISVINTSILNPNISPLFFCILLFYLFFEVFFSFFRKLFFAKQSPLLPDNQHLHMKIYKFLLKRKYSKLKANYSTSIYINFIYLILITPGIIFLESNLFCRYYFLILLLAYIYFYKKIR